MIDTKIIKNHFDKFFKSNKEISLNEKLDLINNLEPSDWLMFWDNECEKYYLYGIKRFNIKKIELDEDKLIIQIVEEFSYCNIDTMAKEPPINSCFMSISSVRQRLDYLNISKADMFFKCLFELNYRQTKLEKN